MQKNIGVRDRILRGVIALILLLCAIAFKNPYFLFAAIFTAYEAAASWCAFYALIGRTTCPLNPHAGMTPWRAALAPYMKGLRILVVAIVLNVIASYIGLANWYDFLKNPEMYLTFEHLFYLFVVYPFTLGFVA